MHQDRVQLDASKTGKRHSIPMTPWLQRHLDRLPKPRNDSRIFVRMPRSTSFKCFYRELGRISSAAGVSDISPQALRRYAITQWSSANAEAGRVVHGSGLGVMAHYLDQFRLLERTAAKVVVPESFLTPAERRQRELSEQVLMDAFRRANDRDRELMLEIAGKIG